MKESNRVKHESVSDSEGRMFMVAAGKRFPVLPKIDIRNVKPRCAEAEKFVKEE